ncbi:hypothetical protein Pla52o_21930 [Novipirellula galeiformis]|uniref:Uncharacterized protein n=1 Tax=Novipirellula galeiformis TaxID=2528004 RepID=A0A5C6CL33_9BACT|nr:hypothetical protein [Novipirellula galeiformis]TWU24267.1 hypothetical protein Pla52o_21930 [Novipirellula galeiformis]
MIYFILWVVFLAVVILAVPIVSLLGNRKSRAPKADTDPAAVAEESEEQAFGENEGFVAEEEAAEVPADDGFGSGEPVMTGDDALEGFDELK